MLDDIMQAASVLSMSTGICLLQLKYQQECPLSGIFHCCMANNSTIR